MRILFALLLSFALGMNASAQRFAMKSNLLVDATASPHLAAELALGRRWTLEVGGSMNVWKMGSTMRWKHWGVQPELRYWFCDRFAGHHIGLHALGGQYNVGGFSMGIPFMGIDMSAMDQSRVQGWFGGAGLSYGYDWMLSRHWNLEAEVGAGYIYTKYDQFRCVGCGQRVSSDTPQHYFGLTKAALSLVYTF